MRFVAGFTAIAVGLLQMPTLRVGGKSEGEVASTTRTSPDAALATYSREVYGMRSTGTAAEERSASEYQVVTVPATRVATADWAGKSNARKPGGSRVAAAMRVRGNAGMGNGVGWSGTTIIDAQHDAAGPDRGGGG